MLSFRHFLKGIISFAVVIVVDISRHFIAICSLRYIIIGVYNVSSCKYIIRVMKFKVFIVIIIHNLSDKTKLSWLFATAVELEF